MAGESKFQSELIEDLEELFPGCVILKNDPDYLQGVLDWSIFFGDRWAMLEAKASKDAPCRPNQEYYVRLFNDMSYASFVFPENKERILRELQSALRPHRPTRVSRRF